MGLHAQGQGLGAAEDQPGLERAGATAVISSRYSY